MNEKWMKMPPGASGASATPQPSSSCQRLDLHAEPTPSHRAPEGAEPRPRPEPNAHRPARRKAAEAIVDTCRLCDRARRVGHQLLPRPKKHRTSSRSTARNFSLSPLRPRPSRTLAMKEPDPKLALCRGHSGTLAQARVLSSRDQEATRILLELAAIPETQTFVAPRTGAHDVTLRVRRSMPAMSRRCPSMVKGPWLQPWPL